MSGASKAMLTLLAVIGVVWLASYLSGEGISIGRSGPNCLYLHATGITKVQQTRLCPLFWDADEEQAL